MLTPTLAEVVEVVAAPPCALVVDPPPVPTALDCDAEAPPPPALDDA